MNSAADLASTEQASTPETRLSKELGSVLTEIIFDAAVDSILVIDDRGRIRAINRSALASFGYSEAELLGQNISVLMPDADARRHDEYMETYMRTGVRKIIGIGREVMGRRKDGSFFPLHLSIGECNSKGQRMFVGICHDISERRRFTERISYLARFDSLTGCVNRHEFVQALDGAMRNCSASNQQLAVLFIDLDQFKLVNDNHGHRAGDRLLRMVAERFKQILREGDLLSRVGGDEFAITTVIHTVDDAFTLAERLLKCLQPPFLMDSTQLIVGASIGISVYPNHGTTADEVMNEADIAMYQAKLEGGNCIRLFDQELRERAEHSYRMLVRLRRALTLDQFELHYQLQFDMETLQPSGIEALLRWRDGENGLVGPAEFIPIALEHGMMPEIGRTVLRKACQDNARLIELGLLDVTVAVNICSPLFSEAGFVPQVLEALHESGLPAERLEIEITEDVAMGGYEQVQRNLEQLLELGVSVAMDDFGVGFSSLDRLKNLHFNKLKIDRSFIMGLPNPRDEAIVHAVIGIARGLNMQAIAEGVENKVQFEFLKRIGCDYGQGYWYARPMPLAELTEWLRRRQEPCIASA